MSENRNRWISSYMFPPPRLIAQGSDLSEAEKLHKGGSALSHNMASTGMEPPLSGGGVPKASQLPLSKLPLSSNWQPKDLANFSFVDSYKAKWLPKYGSAVTSKLMQSLAPSSRGQYTSHWRSFTDWIVKSKPVRTSVGTSP